MDERRANIDLAFRNGLKDYEVLPPPDVWISIDKRLDRKEKPVFLIRAAASLAVLMLLGSLAYFWVAKKPEPKGTFLFAADQESTGPIYTIAGKNDAAIRKLAVASPALTPAPLVAHVPSEPVEQVADQTPVRIANVIPEAGFRIPVKMNKRDIIKHGLGKIEKKEFYASASPSSSAPSLNVNSVNTLYQDYLYAASSESYTPTLKNRWSVSTLASPTYYGKITSGSDQLTKQISESEQKVVTYSGGIAVAYKLNKRFSIQSGLFYSSMGQELEGISSYAGFQKYDRTKGDNNFVILTSAGRVTTNNPDVFLSADMNNARLITSYNKDVFGPQKASLDYLNNSVRQSFSYLEVPVYVKYKVIDRTVDVNLIGGMSYNLLVNNSVYTVIDGSKYMIGTTEGLNSFAISSSVGMDLEYNFSGKFSLNIEPTFRYYMNAFNNSANSQFHPYSFGVFSGITYRF